MKIYVLLKVDADADADCFFFIGKREKWRSSGD